MFKILAQTLIPIFLITTLSTLWSCNSTLKEPDFVGAKNFTVSKIGFQESFIGMDLYYFNPNGFNLQLRKAELDVFLENRFVGKTELDTLLNIHAKDTFSIPVKMGVNMKNLFPNLLTLALKEEVEVRMEGSAKMSKSGITLNVPINYKGKHKIEF
jgi:LEA14-like dessication related protein